MNVTGCFDFKSNRFRSLLFSVRLVCLCLSSHRDRLRLRVSSSITRQVSFSLTMPSTTISRLLRICNVLRTRHYYTIMVVDVTVVMTTSYVTSTVSFYTSLTSSSTDLRSWRLMKIFGSFHITFLPLCRDRRNEEDVRTLHCVPFSPFFLKIFLKMRVLRGLRLSVTSGALVQGRWGSVTKFSL